MKTSTINAKKILVILFWLLVWHFISIRLNSQILLVSPFAVFIRLFDMVKTFEFYKICIITFVKIFSGFIIGFVLGFILAILSYKLKFVYDFINPVIATIKSIPVASFIVLVLVWVSSKYLSTVVSALIVIPVVYSNILAGIKSVPKDMITMAKVFNVPMAKKIKTLYLGSMASYIASAVSIGIGFCFKSGIAAEVIGISKGTIGEAIYTAKLSFETVDVLAWTIVIIVLSVSTEKAVSFLVKKFIKENV